MRREHAPAGPAVWLACSAALALFALPLAALLLRAPWADLPALARRPEVLDAARLSVIVSLGAALAALVAGAPVAWLLARTSAPGRAAIRTLVRLPLVLPPVVAGIALLAAFGRRGLLGSALDAAGVHVPFTTLAAVLAAAFVSAPFLIVTLEAALEQTDPRLERVAATYGASRLRALGTVLLPAIRPSLLAGLALAWGRALGEFGATITFAGNLRGRTQTLTLAIYETLQIDADRAFLLSCVLLAVSVVLLALVRERVGRT